MAGPSSQYFARTPSAASDRRSVALSLPDLELTLTTDRGVFSTDRVDPGTRLLLQEAPHPTPEMGDVLDLGCGYGPIAVALARRAPGARVWAVDVNERAVGLCAENATGNDALSVHPVVVDEDGAPVAGAPDDVTALPDLRFDGIWSNPPIRIGKPALHRLLTVWLDRLAPGGRAWLVVQRHLGADSLAAWLDDHGWPTERAASRAGYRLLRVGAPMSARPGAEDGPPPRNLGGTELKRLHRDWRRRTGGRLGLLLDGVQNPFNVGAILRTAAAFSVDHLWLVGAPSPTDAKVQKTALGSQRFCTWTDHETSAAALDAARAAGYRVVGIELADGSRPLHELDLVGDVCLALGHEDRGLSKTLLAGCDALGYIPQLGRIGSLNVGTATAIACYEVRRAAWTA